MSRPAKPGPWLDIREGIYYAAWYDAEAKRTKRKSLGCRDSKEAESLFAEWLLSRTKPAGRNDEVLIAPVLNDYLSEHLAGKASFARDAERAIKLAEYFGAMTISQLTPKVQQAYVKSQTAAGLKPTSIARDLSVLKAALQRLWKLQEIEQPPHIFMPASSPPRERVLSHDEAGRLIEIAPPHIALYLQLALATAARPSDLLRLQWFQVDFANRRIHMRLSGEAVTTKRKGTIRMSDAVARLLTDWRRSSAVAAHVIAWGGKPLTRRSLHQAIARVAERAKIEKVYPYALRHTAATWLARQGISMHDIAQLLGQSTTRVTERYAKHSPDFMGAATDVMDQQLDQIRQKISRQFRANGSDGLESMKLVNQ